MNRWTCFLLAAFLVFPLRADDATAIGVVPTAPPTTELGKYKALVYRAVGARWYARVDALGNTLPIGEVRIRYTIYSDGTVETKVLDNGGGNVPQLVSISLHAIKDSAPFPPFSPALIEEAGNNFTDDFTFTFSANESASSKAISQ
jgi:hypothetical protein